MKVQQLKDNWYFTSGWLIEHTQAIFNLEKLELTIIGLKYLPKILRYLGTDLDITKVTLKWYRKH